MTQEELFEKQEKKKEFYQDHIQHYEKQFEDGNNSSTDPKNAKHYHYYARAQIELADLLDEEKSKKELRNKANDNLDTAIKLEQSEYHQMWNYHLFARVKADLMEFDIALAYINKALAYPSGVKDQHAAKWNYHLRGRIFFELKHCISAKDDIERSKKIDMLEYENYVLEQDRKQ